MSFLGLCIPEAASGGLFNDLGDVLVFSSDDGPAHAELSGQVDVILHYIGQHPPGVIFNEDRFLLAPRLSLFLDLFLGELFYGFVKLRADRGFDPEYHPPGQARIDEWLLRVRPGNTGLNVQLGKFATVSGKWVGRHEVWDYPFINSLLSYENIMVILDQGTVPDRTRFLQLQDRPDMKGKWLPIIWGLAYTSRVAVFGRIGKMDLAAPLKNKANSSRPTQWGDYD